MPLAAFLVLAGFFSLAIFGGDPSKIPSVLEGKLVPQFSLPALEGSDVDGFTTADLQMGDVVLVNVWASWCVPCRQEHPLLMALAERSGISIFGLNYKDGPADAALFLAEGGNPYKRVGVDRTGRVGIDWGVYGVPETFVVTGEGRIVYKHIGPLSQKAIETKLLPAIEAARLASYPPLAASKTPGS
ncbi:MAG: DsbE family thiol:disulfide interchange protein [Parvibaculaceae bacterium]|nr:DsbE family thiol:disulfide interchange protein [Parvibaculaceae bacterium]